MAELGLLGQQLQLLDEGVLLRAREGARRLDSLARLLPGRRRVHQEVGEQAARAAVEPLRCSGGDGE